ncbi:hypothetical protein [Chryseobacterium gleum]
MIKKYLLFLLVFTSATSSLLAWTNIFLNEDHLKRMVGNLKRWIAYHKN